MVEHDPDGFCWLDQIRSGNRAEVGDKAFYLGLLKQQGFPVLPGFVVTAGLFRRFLSTINWLEPLFADLPESSLHLDVDDPQQLQAIAQRIQHAIQTSPLREDWLSRLGVQGGTLDSPVLLLRPSLALKTEQNSLTGDRLKGLLSSQICQNQPAAIAYALRQVWAELFRAKSLFFWKRSGIQLHQINLAVLVQPMVGAIASGDAQLSGRLYLRAIHGLGLGLTRGEVQPDFYQIEPGHQTIQTHQIGSKRYAYQLTTTPPQPSSSAEGLRVEASDFYQINPLTNAEAQQPALDAAQVGQLVTLFQRIGNILATPLEIEWVWREPVGSTGASLYLTQINRPLSKASEQTSIAPVSPAHASPAPPPTTPSADAIAGIAAAPGQVFAPLWLLPDDPHAQIPTGVVLVTQHLAPHWATQLDAVAGIITEQGGLTSHAAILARELGIPAVVGVSEATQRLQAGSVVWLNGDRGTIQVLKNTSHSRLPPSPPASPPIPYRTTTPLLLNLGRSDKLLDLAQLPVAGVGLLRSEHLLMDRLVDFLHQPDGEALTRLVVQRVQPILSAFAPRPVFYRTLDWRSHEFPHLQTSTSPDPNPLLGVHGTFRDRLQPGWLDAQLKALHHLQQAGFTNLRLLLPFVRTVEEFQFCRDRVLQAGLTQVPEFQLWIMAEVPAVLFLLPDFVAAGVQGISIGSNDLTQLMLAVDRDNSQLAEAYNETHPAVMRAIQHLIQAAQQQGIPCSICGEAPTHYPAIVKTLVEWGISSISVGPNAVQPVGLAIAQAERSRFDW